MLIETMASIKDGQERLGEILLQDLPEFWLRALDILGTKLLYAHGYKTEGIYNIKEREQRQSLPLEQRKVKRTFVMPDGTIAKVV